VSDAVICEGGIEPDVGEWAADRMRGCDCVCDSIPAMRTGKLETGESRGGRIRGVLSCLSEFFSDGSLQKRGEGCSSRVCQFASLLLRLRKMLRNVGCCRPCSACRNSARLKDHREKAPLRRHWALGQAVFGPSSLCPPCDLWARGRARQAQLALSVHVPKCKK